MTRKAVFETANEEKDVPWIEALQIFLFDESAEDVVNLLQTIAQSNDIKMFENVKKDALIYLMDFHEHRNQIIEIETENCLKHWLREVLQVFFKELSEYFPNMEEARTRLQVNMKNSGLLTPNGKWPLSKREKRQDMLNEFAREARLNFKNAKKENNVSVKALAGSMSTWLEILDGYSKRKEGLCDAILHEWQDHAIYDIVGAAEALGTL